MQRPCFNNYVKLHHDNAKTVNNSHKMTLTESMLASIRPPGELLDRLSVDLLSVMTVQLLTRSQPATTDTIIIDTYSYSYNQITSPITSPMPS